MRIALRTQQVIAHESGVTNTVDPLGGAYFVEKLTDEMEAAAYEYFHRIDELGGMVEAIKTGFPQREIADAAFPTSTRSTSAADRRRRQRLRVDGRRVTEIHRTDPAAERKQRGRLERTQAAATTAAAEAALAALGSAAPRTRT